MSLKESERRSYLLGIKIAGDFGANIAAPVVLLVLAGNWVQEKYNLAPFGVIAGFLIAAAISFFLIRRRIKWYAREYEAIDRADADTTDKQV